MNHDVPVLAKETGGVPEAMGDAGIRYTDLPPHALAHLAHLALTDTSLRNQILASQQQRIASLSQRNLANELADLLG